MLSNASPVSIVNNEATSVKAKARTDPSWNLAWDEMVCLHDKSFTEFQHQLPRLNISACHTCWFFATCACTIGRDETLASPSGRGNISRSCYVAVDLTDNEWCWRLDNRWRQTCSPLFTRPCVDTNAVKVLRLTDLLWQTCPWVACWLSLPRATRILWAEAGRKDLRCQPDSVYRLYLTGVLSNLQ